jgi:hypothetical protein
MVWLPTTREVFRAVGPKNPQIYVRGVSGANLENFGEPMLYGIGCFVDVGFLGFLDEHGLADFELVGVY